MFFSNRNKPMQIRELDPEVGLSWKIRKRDKIIKKSLKQLETINITYTDDVIHEYAAYLKKIYNLLINYYKTHDESNLKEIKNNVISKSNDKEEVKRTIVEHAADTDIAEINKHIRALNQLIRDKSPNSSSKSEIDWGKWNSEIPQNKELLKEYLKIEKRAKRKRTWMKNKDGTDFKGTPEQFVQQQNKNFKKAFPKGFITVYRGAHQHIRDFKNRDRNDYATFFTDSVENAKIFASEAKGYFNPEKNFIHDWEDGIYQIAIPKHFPRVTGEGEGRSWRLLNWDDKIAQGIKKIKMGDMTEVDIIEMLNEELRRNAITQYNLKEQYDSSKKYLSTDIFANYIKNPANKEKIFEIKNVDDGHTTKTRIISNVFGVDANRVPIKSLRHNNGMFDMNNPDIYK